jgi:hypothetical protein
MSIPGQGHAWHRALVQGVNFSLTGEKVV